MNIPTPTKVHQNHIARVVTEAKTPVFTSESKESK